MIYLSGPRFSSMQRNRFELFDLFDHSNMASELEESRILSQDEEAFISKLPYKVIPTNLPGVYSNPPLPNDFDHERATQEDLTRHGLMFRKPHPQHSPKAYEAYHRIFHKTPLQKDYIVPVSRPHVG